jgi:7,8-dihydroneopterin aldolase/epimerase/oxygenase
MTGDRVLLRGMVFYGHHGVLPEERERGQRFVIDVTLAADLREAGRTDDLTRTVDYAVVYDEVRQVVEGPPRKLLETVAEEIAARLLQGALVDEVRVRVTKPEPPIAGATGAVGVEIVRRRGEGTCPDAAPAFP